MGPAYGLPPIPLPLDLLPLAFIFPVRFSGLFELGFFVSRKQIDFVDFVEFVDFPIFGDVRRVYRKKVIFRPITSSNLMLHSDARRSKVLQSVFVALFDPNAEVVACSPSDTADSTAFSPSQT